MHELPVYNLQEKYVNFNISNSHVWVFFFFWLNLFLLLQVVVPAARLVAANVPLDASVRAIPAAPAAVNEEVNVMFCYNNVNLFVCTRHRFASHECCLSMR